MSDYKPTLCLDFDGVIHSYASGWKGADVVPDPPVPGALEFILEATEHFRVCIYSSRSSAFEGITAMQRWLEGHYRAAWAVKTMHDQVEMEDRLPRIEWPTTKPAGAAGLSSIRWKVLPPPTARWEPSTTDLS